MKKKLLSLALACGMVFSLAACTNDGAAPATNSPVANTESSAPESQTPSYETASVRVAYMPNMGSGSTLQHRKWDTLRIMAWMLLLLNSRAALQKLQLWPLEISISHKLDMVPTHFVLKDKQRFLLLIALVCLTWLW